jgi:hypothetical protein
VPGERSIARVGVQCRRMARGVLDVGTTYAHSSCQNVAAVALTGRSYSLTGLNFRVVAVVPGWAHALIGIVAEASAAAPQLLLHFFDFLNHRVALVAHELVLAPPFVEGRPTLPRRPHCHGIHDICIRHLFDKDGNVTGYVVLGFNVWYLDVYIYVYVYIYCVLTNPSIPSSPCNHVAKKNLHHKRGHPRVPPCKELINIFVICPSLYMGNFYKIFFFLSHVIKS